MRSSEKFKNRIFLRKIILFVTSGLAVMITVFTMILYFFIEDLVLRIENESNNNLMTQVQYNLRFIEQTIKNTCEHLYLNSDVSYLMNIGNSDSEFEEGLIRINMVWKSVKDANPFIHSIYIYNNNTHKFFSTYNGMLFEDIGLLEYLKKQEALPRMTPVFRKIKADTNFFGVSENVMSYFIYDTYEKDSGMKNGIVVNIKLQWLLDNLDQSAGSSRLFLMDSKGEFVNSEGEEPFLNQIRESYKTLKPENTSGKGGGFFTATYDHEKYFIFYYSIDNASATIFKAVPYKEIHSYVYQLQRVMILLFVIFLVLTIIEALIISRRIYNPFGSMVAQIRSKSAHITDSLEYKDEISFLSNVYSKNAEMLESYRDEKRSNSSIVKTYMLRSLLTEGVSADIQDVEVALKNNGVNIETGTRYAVVIILIDKFEELMKGWSLKERDLVKFAILNIGCEVIGRELINDGLDMEEDRICILLSLKDRELHRDTLLPLIEEIQSVLLKHYGISVTATVSSRVETLNDLPKAYTQAQENSYYRYIFGRKAVIFPEQITKIEDAKNLENINKMEKRLYEALMTGEAEKVEQELRADFEQLSGMSYEEVIISQVQLLKTMNQAITELNRNRLDTITLNFNELYRLPFHMETMEDMLNHLIELLQGVMNKDKAKLIDSRHSLLIETAMAIIHEKYNYSSLCQDEIAISLNISTRQLSRIFKSGTGRTVPEQINEVRMAKAAELLEQTNLNVSEIAMKVGIESETYFYSMFKKKFGTTPKEYTAIKTLKKN